MKLATILLDIIMGNAEQQTILSEENITVDFHNETVRLSYEDDVREISLRPFGSGLSQKPIR